MTTVPACQHTAGACCLLCSDQRSFWRAARLALGYGSEPPNEPWKPPPPPKCEIEGCGRPHSARGLCKWHYERGRRELIRAGQWVSRG